MSGPGLRLRLGVKARAHSPARVRLTERTKAEGPRGTTNNDAQILQAVTGQSLSAVKLSGQSQSPCDFSAEQKSRPLQQHWLNRRPGRAGRSRVRSGRAGVWEEGCPSAWQRANNVTLCFPPTKEGALIGAWITDSLQTLNFTPDFVLLPREYAFSSQAW